MLFVLYLKANDIDSRACPTAVTPRLSYSCSVSGSDAKWVRFSRSALTLPRVSIRAKGQSPHLDRPEFGHEPQWGLVTHTSAQLTSYLIWA